MKICKYLKCTIYHWDFDNEFFKKSHKKTHNQELLAENDRLDELDHHTKEEWEQM